MGRTNTHTKSGLIFEGEKSGTNETKRNATLIERGKNFEFCFKAKQPTSHSNVVLLLRCERADHNFEKKNFQITHSSLSLSHTQRSLLLISVSLPQVTVSEMPNHALQLMIFLL